MSSENKKKMIIIGLDNAGKTTILLTMKRQLSPHEYHNIQPTKGLQTETFTTKETSYHVWDFGGQEVYRQKYMETPSYFESTDTLVFVIDIQEKARFELALKYLNAILKIISTQEKQPDCSVFFHKFDPELADSKEYQKRSKDLRKKIREIYAKYNYSFKVFHTTIYTVFERTQVM